MPDDNETQDESKQAAASPKSSASVSTPAAPKAAKIADVPAGDQAWELRKWSGLDQYHCLFPVRHLRADTEYTLPCHRDFWSQDELMDHFRSDH